MKRIGAILTAVLALCAAGAKAAPLETCGKLPKALTQFMEKNTPLGGTPSATLTRMKRTF